MNEIMDNEENKYNTEYIYEFLREKYHLDIRDWPNGINREEFDRCWENNFSNIIFDGHLHYILVKGKNQNLIDKEIVWSIIEKIKVPAFKKQMSSWKESAIEDMRTGSRWAETNWGYYNFCRKVLGLPQDESFHTKLISERKKAKEDSDKFLYNNACKEFDSLPIYLKEKFLREHYKPITPSANTEIL